MVIAARIMAYVRRLRWHSLPQTRRYAPFVHKHDE